MKNKFVRSLSFISIIFLSLMNPLFTQDFSSVQIKTDRVTERIFMLSGGGGNIGVFTGAGGILLIDSMYAQLHEKIKAAVKNIKDQPVHFLINTHTHFDHVNGNESFAASGVRIIAQVNVRRQMKEGWFHPLFPTKISPYPEIALPLITFNKSLTLHFNGDDVEMMHMENGHTDGDTVVFFKEANVLQMGDLYFARAYPFIDVPHGGSVDGIIKALDRILDIADENTKIIPGHGPLSNAKELRSYQDMLSTIRNRVLKLIKEGKTEKEVIAAKPTKGFDSDYKLAFQPDIFVKILYSDLSRK